MAWALAPNVSYCVASGQVFFLDLVRDRYFGLPLSLSEVFLAWAGLADPAPLPSPLVALETAGLVQRDAATRALSPTRGPAHAPSGEIAPGLEWDTGPERVYSAFLYLARARHALRNRSLYAILSELSTSFRADDTAPSLAAAFLAARNWLPRRPACLLDSLALRLYLDGHDARASLVFGVQATPFAAHCWVEREGVILNDQADRIRSFTPILVR
jgi:hypothetical protein